MEDYRIKLTSDYRIYKTVGVLFALPFGFGIIIMAFLSVFVPEVKSNISNIFATLLFLVIVLAVFIYFYTSRIKEIIIKADGQMTIVKTNGEEKNIPASEVREFKIYKVSLNSGSDLKQRFYAPDANYIGENEGPYGILSVGKGWNDVFLMRIKSVQKNIFAFINKSETLALENAIAKQKVTIPTYKEEKNKSKNQATNWIILAIAIILICTGFYLALKFGFK